MIIEIEKDFAAKYWSNQVFSVQSWVEFRVLNGLLGRQFERHTLVAAVKLCYIDAEM